MSAMSMYKQREGRSESRQRSWHGLGYHQENKQKSRVRRNRGNTLHTSSSESLSFQKKTIQRMSHNKSYQITKNIQEPYRSPGLYYDHFKKAHMLVGEHTGLKARKVNRSSHRFTQVNKDELLQFFKLPNARNPALKLWTPSINASKNNFVLKKHKKGNIETFQDNHSDRIKENEVPSIMFEQSRKQSSKRSYIAGWQHEKESSHITINHPSSRIFYQTDINPSISSIRSAIRNSASQSQNQSRTSQQLSTMKSSEQSLSIKEENVNIPKSSFKISQQFQYVNIVQPSQSQNKQILPSIAFIEQAKQRNTIKGEFRSQQTVHPLCDIINTRMASRTSRKRLQKQKIQSIEVPISHHQNRQQEVVSSHKSVIQKSQNLKIKKTKILPSQQQLQNKTQKQVQSNTILQSNLNEESVNQDQLLRLNSILQTAKPCNIKPTDSQIYESKFMQSNYNEQQPQSQSLFLIKTLHSKAGTIQHIRDSNSPNKLQIRQPALMVSFNGSLTGSLIGSKTSQIWAKGTNTESCVLTESAIIHEQDDEDMKDSAQLHKNNPKYQTAFTKKKDRSVHVLQNSQQIESSFKKKSKVDHQC